MVSNNEYKMVSHPNGSSIATLLIPSPEHGMKGIKINIIFSSNYCIKLMNQIAAQTGRLSMEELAAQAPPLTEVDQVNINHINAIVNNAAAQSQQINLLEQQPTQILNALEEAKEIDPIYTEGLNAMGDFMSDIILQLFEQMCYKVADWDEEERTRQAIRIESNLYVFEIKADEIETRLRPRQT